MSALLTFTHRFLDAQGGGMWYYMALCGNMWYDVVVMVICPVNDERITVP